jgi:hypothetical protein
VHIFYNLLLTSSSSSSSSSSLALQPGVGFSLLHNTPPFGGSSEGFVTIILFWCGVVSPTPNLEDQVSIFISPGDWVAQLYSQAPSTHFSRLLRHACATVGLFFSPVTTRGLLIHVFFIYERLLNLIYLWFVTS